jgi:hypothetical protein
MSWTTISWNLAYHGARRSGSRPAISTSSYTGLWLGPAAYCHLPMVMAPTDRSSQAPRGNRGTEFRAMAVSRGPYQLCTLVGGTTTKRPELFSVDDFERPSRWKNCRSLPASSLQEAGVVQRGLYPAEERRGTASLVFPILVAAGFVPTSGRRERKTVVSMMGSSRSG